jgi:CHAT domain-containing protein
MKRSVFLLLLTLALPINADDTPESTVSAFYTAYAAGDVQKAAGYWEPAAARAFAKVERHLRTRCLQHHRVTIGVPVINGSSATIDAEAVATVWSDAPGARPRVDTGFTTFELAHTDRWRITRWIDRESVLAERVAELKSADERKALLANAGPLRTARLAEELCRRAIVVYVNHSEYDAASAVVSIAREIAMETGDDAALSTVHVLESMILFQRSGGRDFSRSIEAATEALALAERSGDPDVIAQALLYLGRAQFSLRSRVVRPPFERALALADFVDDASVIGAAATQLAFAAVEANNPSSQLRYGLLALHYAEIGGDDAAAYNAHFAVGEAYLLLGYLGLAIKHYAQMVPIGERAGDGSDVANALLKLATGYIAAGREDDAQKAIARAIPLGDTDMKAELLLMRSDMARIRLDTAAAERDLTEALRFAPDHVTRFKFMKSTVELRLLQGRNAEALDLANELTRQAARQSAREQLTAAACAAKALRRMHRFDEARARLAEVRRMVEEAHATTAIHEDRWTSFYAGRSGYEVEEISLAIDTGDAGAALRAANSINARALRAFIEHRRSAPSLLMSDEELAQEKTLNARIAELNRQLVGSGASKTRSAELQKEIERTRLDLDELRANAASARAKSPPMPAPVQDPVTFVPADVVVQYLFTEDGIIVIGMSPGEGHARRIIATRVDVNGREMSKKVDALLELLESRDLRYAQASREMFDLLLEPVRSMIGSGRMLCIIPDAELWRVPFQALRAPDGRYLAEITPLYYAPALALADLARTSERRPRPSEAPALLAFANPQLNARSVAQYRSAFTGAVVGALPDAEQEVREIARLYGSSHSRVFIGETATETNLKKQSGRVGVIHIATHGAVDAASPLASAMLLAPGATTEDGVLEAREVLDLGIESDLAVLSACSSGGGKAEHAEGIIGLSWAFLATGCPTTVVSQWKATSSVTSRLMIEFHRRLRAGDSAGVALQKAQNHMRRDNRYRHPYYWAPFVVVGAQ